MRYWFGVTVVLYLVMLSVFARGEGPDVPAAAEQTTAPQTAAPSDEEAAARQLRIFKEALLQGTTETIRVDAAVSLLLQNDSSARATLISALQSDENPLARLAVCKALIKSRGLSQTINSRGEYLEPLIAILKGNSVEQAQVASEALLIFDYQDIEKPICELAENTQLGRQVRVQAIDALQIRPEPAALRVLIKLLDDQDSEVVRAAETSLQEAFGIPVGTSRSDWAIILEDLQRKKPDEIRRDRLLRQETKLREVQAERDRWQKLFIGAIDKQFETMDETGRIKMLQEAMASDLSSLRLWMLDKVAKYPVTGERLRTGLLELLSDSSRDVRLQTAKVLTTMSALNPAEKLLERFKVEKDAELALAMFEALGEACFFAYSPGSGIELPVEIKMETLEIAAGYLKEEQADPAKKGAEVIRKILELNKIPEETAKTYLTELCDRYEKSKEQPGTLRADLLGILAHLCGQGNLKTLACGIYQPLFVAAIEDKTNGALRLSAAKGLVYVDKSKALEIFRQLGLNADESIAVQQVVIEATGQAGDVEDLGWLVTALLNNYQSEQVWLAVKNICQRQKAEFLVEWISQMETAPGVTAEQIREVLEIAELKAEGESNKEMLAQARQRILAIFCRQNSWEQASAYLTKFNYSVKDSDFSDEVNIGILQVFLYTNQPEKAAELCEKRLSQSDVPNNCPWTLTMMAYLMDESVTAENKKAFVEKAGGIQIQDRPEWTLLIENARKTLGLSQPAPIAEEQPEKLVSQES